MNPTQNPAYSGHVNCDKCGRQHWIGTVCGEPAPDRIAELERLTTELTETKAKLAEADKLRTIACQEWAEDDTAIKAIATAHGIDCDPTPGYFTSHVEVMQQLSAKLGDMTEARNTWKENAGKWSKEIATAKASLAESERRMAQEHFEKMYALQDRLEKAEMELAVSRANEAVCHCGQMMRHHGYSDNHSGVAMTEPCPYSIDMVEAKRELAAANTRALEAEAQVERMKADLGSARNLSRGAMTPSETELAALNKQVAELSGWKPIPPPFGCDLNGNRFPGFDEPPNFVGSLDLMHGVEKTLTDEQANKYTQHLARVTFRHDLSICNIANFSEHAEAWQRATAFVKVKKEGK